MTGFDRGEADRLFTRLLDLPPDEREAALDEACADNGVLREAVVRLLRGAEAATSIVDPGLGWTDGLWEGLAREASRRESPFEPGARVGPYRILEEIERGGMAVVYRAERADGELTRQVAVKVLKLGLDTEEVVRRFEQERQILADLDHSAIARLYDAGRTDDGRPYFVMELVEGLPIDRYCDEHRLTVEERLELFCVVAEAVDFAHRNLVVHRDLKPSNILVGHGVAHGSATSAPGAGEGIPRSKPQVKLLDFGIARLLDVDAGGQGAAAPTRALVRMMTPEYASPEQVRGERVTPASDVYQLGLLLYELLSGHRAYALGNREPEALRRVICEQMPTRPSSAVLREETVTESGDRPAAANGAAGMDAGRFREPEGSIASLTRTTSVSGVPTVEDICHARRTSPGRLRRRLRGDLDNIVLQALRKDPERRYRGADRMARDVRRHLEGLPVTARSDTWVYRGRKFLARHALGATTTALLLAAAAGVAGFHTTRIRVERDRAQIAASKAEQVSQFLTGLFESADPRLARGEELTARELLERGVAEVDRELARQPMTQAQMLQVLGRTYLELDSEEEAEALLRRSLELRRARLGQRHPDVASVLTDLGLLHYRQGAYEHAQGVLEEASRIFQGSPDESATRQVEALVYLGEVYRRLDQHDRARTTLEQALAIEPPASGRASLPRADGLHFLGRVHFDLGALRQTEAFYERALAIYERELGTDYPGIGIILSDLADIQWRLGKRDGAEALYRRAIAILEEAYGATHTRLRMPLNNLGNFLVESGEPERAIEVLRRAVAIEPEGGAKDPGAPYPLTTLGDAYLTTGRLEEARRYYERSIALHSTTLEKRQLEGNDQFDLLLFHTLVMLGRTSAELGDDRAAEHSLQSALAVWNRAATPSTNARVASSLRYLGQWLVDHGRCVDAAPLLRQAALLPTVHGDPLSAGVEDPQSLLATCADGGSAVSVRDTAS